MWQVEISTTETCLVTDVTSRNFHNWDMSCYCYKSKFPQLRHVLLLMLQVEISTAETCLATVTYRNFHNWDTCYYWRYKSISTTETWHVLLLMFLFEFPQLIHVLLLLLQIEISTTATDVTSVTFHNETRIAADVTSVNFHNWDTFCLTANVTSEISTTEICLAVNEAIKRRVHKWNTSGCWCNKGGDIMATDVARRRGVWLVKLKAWISTTDAGRLAAVDVTSVAALGHDWDHDKLQASIYIFLSRSPFFCGEWCRKARLSVRSSKEHHLLGQNATCEFSV